MGRTAVRRWLDASAQPVVDGPEADCIDWVRIIPFIAMHTAVPLVFLVGWSPVAVWTAVGLYAVRMFAITGFYHRYFSHRSFRTSRAVQLIFAVIGASSVQRGPMWWAAHHRVHHRNSDGADDLHSPRQRGFLHSHMGWFLNRKNFATQLEQVPDLARFPELRFLDRFDIFVPIVLALGLFVTGELLETHRPELGTSGGQLLVWGFVVSTVVLFHATFTINSLAHTWGRRRYSTPDDSRNNLFLALLTFGEGWHNNHHYSPGSVRQGFRWYEIDLTWYVLWTFSKLGIVSDLRPVPRRVLEEEQ